MKQHIRSFHELFEQKIDIPNKNWVDLYENGMIELQSVSIEVYGLPLAEIFTVGGISDLESRAIEYGIVKVNHDTRSYSSGLKSEIAEFVAPNITVDWFKKKLTLLDKLLVKRYGGRNRVQLEFRINSDIPIAFHTLYINKWKSVLKSTKDRVLKENVDPDQEEEEILNRLEDVQAMVDMGMLGPEEARSTKRLLINKHKESMQTTVDGTTGIDMNKWFNSKYARILTNDLFKAIKTDEFKALKKKGFMVKPSSPTQLLNGTIIFYVPGIKSKIGVYSNSKKVKRITPGDIRSTGGSTELKTFSETGVDFYRKAFEYIATEIDVTDTELATVRGAEIKRKRAEMYDLMLEEIKDNYRKFFPDEMVELIISRKEAKSSRRWEYDYDSIFSKKRFVREGPALFKEIIHFQKKAATHNAVYLGISSYDAFFTKELENYFVEHEINWICSNSVLYAGAFQYKHSHERANDRNHELWYTALPLVDFPMYYEKKDPHVSSQAALRVNWKDIGNGILSKLYDKVSEYEDKDLTLEIESYPR